MKSRFLWVKIGLEGGGGLKTEDSLLIPSTVHTLIIVNNQDHLNVKRLFCLLPSLCRLVIDYDLLVTSISNFYPISSIAKNMNSFPAKSTYRTG